MPYSKCKSLLPSSMWGWTGTQWCSVLQLWSCSLLPSIDQSSLYVSSINVISKDITIVLTLDELTQNT